MSEFKREQRYYVFKVSDMERYWPHADTIKIASLSAALDLDRINSGKPPLKCLVIESDWSEYDPGWMAIEARVTGKPVEDEAAKLRALLAECLPVVREHFNQYEAMARHMAGGFPSEYVASADAYADNLHDLVKRVGEALGREEL